MMLFLFAILLQVQIALPQRVQLENPSAGNPLPKQVQKDFDKLWKRFLTGKEDAKVYRDLDKLLKKSGDAAPLLIVQSYIDLYGGRPADAEDKFQEILSKYPSNTTALLYVAEFAYAHGDFVRATELFGKLRTANPSVSGIEMKSQRSLLLAMDSLLQDARRAIAENRLDDAERLYRRALGFAPKEASLHGQLAEILSRQGKDKEAAAEVHLQSELDGFDGPDGLDGSDVAQPIELKEGREKTTAATGPDEDLARWGGQIERFREIRASQSVTREQLAGLLARYFPQLKELGNAPEIMTDVDGSWAESAIQTVVSAGLLGSMANHTFQPARTVTRGEFAQAVGRLIQLLGVSSGDARPITASDVVPDSPLERELQPVLGYELLTLDNAGNFSVGGPVRGEEAVNAAEKLRDLFHK